VGIQAVPIVLQPQPQQQQKEKNKEKGTLALYRALSPEKKEKRAVIEAAMSLHSAFIVVL
jgi:hypothetical protein